MKLLDKLNLIAKERQVLPDKIRQHYAMERFLYRLSLSSHARNGERSRAKHLGH